MWMLGKTVQRLGDERAAFDWFAKAWDLKPGNADVAREASLSAMNLGMGVMAVEYCEEALTIEPRNPGLLSNLALSQLLAGRPQDALETVREALELDSQDTVTAAVHRLIHHVVVSKSAWPRSSAEMHEYCRRHRHELGDG
jgi:Flp pilus assembly protein TadD